MRKSPSQSPITRPSPEGTFAFLDGFDTDLFPELNDVDLPPYEVPLTDRIPNKCEVTTVAFLSYVKLIHA